MDGIINIYKEKGYTSFDVVAKLRGILKQRKIGHTGTLDPDAEGVLPVCLGNGTKLCEYLTDKSKEYVATMRLGVRTDTLDMSGEIVSEADVNVSENQIQSTVLEFVGEIMQVPPMYSALKVNGNKLCDLARKGIFVERKARPVTIYGIDILEIRLPIVTMRVKCSKGTYIRTLCDDIGNKLGCYATMESLKRTRVDNFTIEDALWLSEIEQLVRDGRIDEQVVSLDMVFAGLDKVIVCEEADKFLMNGNMFAEELIKETIPGVERDCGVIKLNSDKISRNNAVRVYSSVGKFVGIYSLPNGESVFKPVKMFLASES